MLRPKSLLLCCCSILLSSANRCPDPETLEPCKCPLLGTMGVYVNCVGIQQVQVLKKVFRDTTDHPLGYLTLKESAFNFFPADALKQKSVRTLDLEKVTMVSLFDRMPEENHKLLSLHITESKIFRGIQWEQLKNLHNLTNLVIMDVGLRSLRQDFTDNVPPDHLIVLRLVNNGLYKLHDTAFSRMSKLLEVHVIGGRITTLKRSMFPKENVIQVLAFGMQHISTLPSDIFNDMPRLNQVLLHENKFTTISEIPFKVLKDRHIDLYLTDNEIHCDCRIIWAVGSDWSTRAVCFSPDYRNAKGRLIGGSFPDMKSLTRDDIWSHTLTHSCP